MTEAAGLRSIDGMDRAMEAARTKHIKSFRASDAAALWEISTTLAVQLVLFAAHPVLPFCTFVPVAALMFIRWFVLFHDAGHGSLAASPALNRLLHRFCGVCCWTPCDWRGKHRLHHATAGNLDNDFGFNFNEICPFTAAQHSKWPAVARVGYLIVRHSQILWFLLPFWAWGITFRLPLNQPHVIVVERLFNTFATTLKLWGIFYIYGSACFWDFCTAAYVGMVLGVILFHAQHSFEEGYCARKSSWSFSDAAFRGSSCIRVPWFLRWFTMGIEYHMIHHFDTKVPGYLLQACHDTAPTDFWSMVRYIEYKDWLNILHITLYDEGEQRYVGFERSRRLCK